MALDKLVHSSNVLKNTLIALVNVSTDLSQIFYWVRYKLIRAELVLLFNILSNITNGWYGTYSNKKRNLYLSFFFPRTNIRNMNKVAIFSVVEQSHRIH